MDELEAQVRRGGGNGGGGYNSGLLPKINVTHFIQMVDNKLHYFHSCGLYNYKINACRPSTRKPGHKAESTVTNRLGVATAVPAALLDLGIKMK